MVQVKNLALGDQFASRGKTFFATATPFPKKQKRLLVIEDDLEMGEMVRDCLQVRYQCQVDVANDPFEAINKMTDKFYDLIILDWQLPALTGGEVLKATERELYFEPDLPIQWDSHRVPVVIFSAFEKAKCAFNKSKHFNCIGFVSKRQPLKSMVNSFAEFMDQFIPKVAAN